MNVTPNLYYTRQQLDDFIKHFKSSQFRSRIEFLFQLPMFGRVAEIGVAGGNFSECINTINQPRQLSLIDCWKKQPQRVYQNDSYNRSQLIQDHLYKSVLKRFSKNPNIKIIKNFSAHAAKSFEDGYFDWIYLDANHAYESVHKDLLVWRGKVNPRGIIAGNDYTDLSFFHSGVVQAVDEFCKQEKWLMYLIDDDPWHNYALGKDGVTRTNLSFEIATNFKKKLAKYQVYNHLLLFLRNRGLFS